MKGKNAMFFSSWVARNPGPTRDKEDYYNFFEPFNLRLEDLQTLTGVGFIKTVKAFYDKMLATRVLESCYPFKEDSGKKSHLNFKWEGNDFVIDTTNVYLQKTKTSTTKYHPAFYINKYFALEMGWFVEKGEDTYDLGPNLVMEVHNDEMPVPVDTDPVNKEY